MNPVQNVNEQRLTKFRKFIVSKETEDVLIKKILTYAKKGDFTRYTSTLEEAWRLSIHGLSESLGSMIDKKHQIPELHVETDYLGDPASKFGIYEAQMHRSRGITITMFLALMKYYKQSYLDVIEESE